MSSSRVRATQQAIGSRGYDGFAINNLDARIAIDRADGVRHDLSPRGSAGNYVDQDGRAAYRNRGLGSRGGLGRGAGNGRRRDIGGGSGLGLGLAADDLRQSPAAAGPGAAEVAAGDPSGYRGPGSSDHSANCPASGPSQKRSSPPNTLM